MVLAPDWALEGEVWTLRPDPHSGFIVRGGGGTEERVTGMGTGNQNKTACKNILMTDGKMAASQTNTYRHKP